jgi:hypothetical protein
VLTVCGDRLQAGTLAPLGERRWDLVLDTWSGAPRATRDSARLLGGRADRYVYISSGSVYSPPPPMGVAETAATVGHATMGTLLEACAAVAGRVDTRLNWVPASAVLAAGIEPWSELPIWIPREHEYAAMHGADVSRAHAAGLRCRPLEETVADTWAWLAALDGPAPLRADLPALGLSPERERAALASAGH